MAAVTEADVPGLADIDTFPSSHAELARSLLAAGQVHLFEGWEPGRNNPEKEAFFESLMTVQDGYPGGIPAYCESARKLLASSAAGENPFEGLTPEVPTGFKLEYGSAEFVAAETRGIEVFRDCAFVLVAGGLGERLGYSGIKVSLPTQTTTGTCYLELYVRQILALQAESNRRAGTSSVVPLAIMTSGDTHEKTVELLKRNSDFGAADGQITIIKQELVPALVDNDAHIARAEGSKFKIITKPHGHGDVHTLLASSGLAAKWAREGRKYVSFFQDTNAMCFKVITAAIGTSDLNGLACNSLTVPREAGAAVGAITRLVNKATGEAITINVEYNQLAPLLTATINPDGDVADATGFSPFPGNINQLVFALPAYKKALDTTGGLVPEFVNPKYADDAKTTFKKPTRLECMMQDFPRLLTSDDVVGFTQFETWTYSPVKNSLDEARAKVASGNSPACASEGEMNLYGAECRALTMLGADVAAGTPFEALGITVTEHPRVVIDPRLACSFMVLKRVFPTPSKVRIAAGATLVLEGSNIVIESLDLEGALVVRGDGTAPVVVRGMVVRNAGYEFERLADDHSEPESLAIRGYKLKKVADELVDVSAGGGVVVGSSL